MQELKTALKRRKELDQEMDHALDVAIACNLGNGKANSREIETLTKRIQQTANMLHMLEAHKAAAEAIMLLEKAQTENEILIDTLLSNIAND